MIALLCEGELLSTISYDDIIEIYVQTIEGLKQQSLTGEFENFWTKFPRDPLFVAKGLEAVYGLRIFFKFDDFYRGISDVSDESKDLYCFHEHYDDGKIDIYINTGLNVSGKPLVSKQTLRFVVLKELFIAVLRRSFAGKGRHYPDTVEYGKFGSSILDIIVEKPSIFDIGGADDSPVPSIENAAEILSLLLLVDLEKMFILRKEITTKHPVPSPVGSNGDLEFTLFDYEKHSTEYNVRVRLMYVLIKTDFVIKMIEGVKSLVKDIKELFPKIEWPK
jgi:hypothetical protein